MMIPRRLIVNPDENGILAVTFSAMSVFILAYSLFFGQIAILLFLGMWLALPLAGPARASRVAPGVALLLLLPMFACASVLWSDFPAHTLRAALQYLSLAVCAAIAATYVSVRSMAWGLMIGCHLVVGWSLISGEEAYDYFGNSYAFAGLFPSKNTFGFFASIGVLAACAVIALSAGRTMLRMAVAAAGLIFLYALVISSSATSLVSLAGAIFALLMGLLVGRLHQRLRRKLMIGLLVALPLIATAVAFIDIPELISLTGRDTTLTGRTDLWLAGLSVFAEAPILGVGYQSFWMPGVPLAEQLWHDFFITSQIGFHFHSTFIGILADLGIVGFILYLLPLGSSFFGATRQVLRVADNREGAICLSFVVLLLIRSFVEIDAFAAYTIGTFTFFYFAVLPYRQSAEIRHVTQARYRAEQAELNWTFQ